MLKMIFFMNNTDYACFERNLKDSAGGFFYVGKALVYICTSNNPVSPKFFPAYIGHLKLPINELAD